MKLLIKVSDTVEADYDQLRSPRHRPLGGAVLAKAPRALMENIWDDDVTGAATRWLR